MRGGQKVLYGIANPSLRVPVVFSMNYLMVLFASSAKGKHPHAVPCMAGKYVAFSVLQKSPRPRQKALVR